jgi:transcriptional regulator with XRE-family HTH domain
VQQDPKKMVAANIRRIREAKGFTQEEFAFYSRFDRAYFGRVERGDQSIALGTLFRIAHALDVAPGELFQGISAENCGGRPLRPLPD